MAEDTPEKEAKWPWSITDREFGALEQELKEVRHDHRNLKIVVDASDIFDRQVRESLTNLQNLKARRTDLNDLQTEFNQFKTKVYTAFSIIVLLAGAVAWLVDVVLRIIPND